MAKKILFSHNAMFLPVIKELAPESELWTFDDGFTATLSNLDIQAKPLTSMVTPVLKDSALLEAGKLVTAAYSVNGTGDVNTSVSKFVKDKLPAFIYARAADIAVLVLSLDVVKPDVIVVHNDVEPMLRVAATWAKTREIPCLHVPHAIYQNVGRGAVGTDIHDIVTASYLAAAGSYQAEWYRIRGMLNIKETGLPQFDKWATMPKERTKALRLLHLAPIKAVVVYLSTWRQNTNLLGCNDEWASTYMTFLEAIKDLDLQVIVKLHPHGGQDSAKWHVEVAQKSGAKCIVTAQYLDTVFQVADLAIGPFGSTTLIEASYMPGCRLMTMEGHGYFEDAVVLKTPNTKEGIAKAIVDALQNEVPDATEFRTKYAGPADGKAYLRVVDYVRGL